MTQTEEMPPEVSSELPELDELDYQSPFLKETTSSTMVVWVLIATIVSFAIIVMSMMIGT